MHRRALFPMLAGLAIVPAASKTISAASPAQPGPPADGAFDNAMVRNLARDLALKPYQAPDSTLPDALRSLDYAAYQTLRFDKSKALWRGDGRKFAVEFFHRGYLFKDKVEVFEVADGRARLVRYVPEMFDVSHVSDYAKSGTPPPADLGFAGFRIHFPINRADVQDEVGAFLGASYFRAVAKGQGYGLSARGLSIKTADPGGEEFPIFKTFWLERPGAGSDVMVIHALLDSPSAAAAFRFTLRPGAETVMDTEMALYPRTDLTQAGLAPMTSMFLFDANNRTGFDDYRNAVHDSNGMQVLTGRGEHLWRALNNAKTLQVSAFADSSPRGFGLAQRERSLLDYQDLEASYEKRPTLWCEPIGDWGQGAVTLVEIPSDREVNDNMVAFWRPKDKLSAKGEYILSYRLHWCWNADPDATLATVAQTRGGLSFDQKNRQFVIDFAGGGAKGRAESTKPELDLSADKGKILNATLQPVPGGEAWRLAFQLDPGGEKTVELRARLLDAGKPISETWIYRWTS